MAPNVNKLKAVRDLLNEILASNTEVRTERGGPPERRVLPGGDGVVEHRRRTRTADDAPESVAEAAELAGFMWEDRGYAKSHVKMFVCAIAGLGRIEPKLDNVTPAHIIARLACSTSMAHRELMLRWFVTFFDDLRELGWWTASRNPAKCVYLNKVPLATKRTRLVSRPNRLELSGSAVQGVVT